MRHHETLILGAGPAGLQAGYFLGRAGRDYQIVERGSVPGAFFAQFPRHRRLISINKVHTGYRDRETNLRWDWNSLLSDEDDGPLFKSFSTRYFPPASALEEYLVEYTRHHALAVEYGADIVHIRRSGHFLVTARDGREWSCDRLVVATGVSRENIPAIPGIEQCETYGGHSIDPEDYVGQRVLIIGKGNSGFETADNLVETAAAIHVVSPRPLKMAWRTHFVGDLRACNNNLLDTYQLKSQNAVMDAVVERIERAGEQFAVTFRYAHAGGEVETLHYDRVISCAGFRFDPSAFEGGARPELSPCGRFPAQTCEWESINVPDLFFAGTLMQIRDLKKYMSGFIHGFRYNVRALVRVLEARYYGRPWPVAAHLAGAEATLGWLIERINRASALWQQPGFLCDVVRLGRTAEGPALVHEELPVDLAREKLVPSDPRVLLLTLEFGADSHADPFHVERVNRENYARAGDSQFLHPIVRYYENGRLETEHHVIEDLAAEWREPEHIEPLRDFLGQVLSARPAPRAA